MSLFLLFNDRAGFFTLLDGPVRCLNFTGIFISSLRQLLCLPETCVICAHRLPAYPPLPECNSKIVGAGVDIHARVRKQMLRFYSVTGQFVEVQGIDLHEPGAEPRNRIVSFNVSAEI